MVYAVGRKLDPGLLEVQSEYIKRLSRWVQVTETLVPPSKGDPAEVIEQDSKNLLGKIKTSDLVVLLDERGQQYSSPKFAEKLEVWSAQQRSVIFVIGGAFGVDESVRTRADVVWSLSELVFPHELVRVLLYEQLYRAQCIQHNLPYHHV